MRIISNFKDYYDPAVTYSTDVTYVRSFSLEYLRKDGEMDTFLTSILQAKFGWTSRLSMLKVYDSFNTFIWNIHGAATWVRPVFIFFCGKVYVIGMAVTEPGRSWTPVFSKEQVLEIGIDNLLKIGREREANRLREKGIEGLYSQAGRSRMFLGFGCADIPPDLFLKHNSPCMAVCYNVDDRHGMDFFGGGSWSLLVNPSLANFKFYKLVDPYTAAQEIEMYIGGVLGAPQAPTEVISDEVRIQQHGFDKLSFRKSKENKK